MWHAFLLSGQRLHHLIPGRTPAQPGECGSSILYLKSLKLMCDSRTEHVTWRSVTRPWMTRRQEEAFVPPLGWSCRKRDPASKQSPYSHRGLACNPSYKILPTLLFTEAPALLRQQLIPPEPFPGYNGKAYLCLNSKPPYSRPVDFRNNQSGRLPKSDINIPDAAPRQEPY